MKRLLIGLCFLPLCSIGQTIDEVLEELEKQDVWYPKVVLAQAILETRWIVTGKHNPINNLFILSI